MTKKESVNRWKNLEPNQNPLRNMTPIPKGTKGSRYGCCSIRVTGNPDFMDDVLSCLKPLLDGESQTTRLSVSINDVKPTEVQGQVKTFSNADPDAEVCYIQLHERGPKAALVNILFDRKE